MRDNPVKRALLAGQPSIGTWLSLCSPIAARFLARSAFDWLTVDMEHSPYNWETAAILIASIADAGNKLGPAKLLLTHPADGALASYDPSSGTIYVGHAVFLGGAIDVAARAPAPRPRIIQTQW